MQHMDDSSILIRGHGVHTYEHLRAIILAAYANSNVIKRTKFQSSNRLFHPRDR